MNTLTYLLMKAGLVALPVLFAALFVTTFWNHDLALWLADTRTAILLAAAAGTGFGILYAVRPGIQSYAKALIDFMWNSWSFVAVGVFFYAVLWKLPPGPSATWSFDFLGLLQVMQPALKTAWFTWATFAGGAKMGIALADARRAIPPLQHGDAS